MKLKVGDRFLDNSRYLCIVVEHDVTQCQCESNEFCLKGFDLNRPWRGWEYYYSIREDGSCNLGKQYSFKRRITNIDHLFYGY